MPPFLPWLWPRLLGELNKAWWRREARQLDTLFSVGVNRFSDQNLLVANYRKRFSVVAGNRSCSISAEFIGTKTDQN